MDSDEEEAFEFNTKTNFEGTQAKIQEEQKTSQNFNTLKQITNEFYDQLSKNTFFSHDISWKTFNEIEPISITINSIENKIGLLDIVSPKDENMKYCNTFFRKVLITLSSLYSEIDNILMNKSNINYYHSLYPLSMYNETIDSEIDKQNNISNDEAAAQMSRMIIYLKDLYDKVISLLNLAINLLCQLIHLYSSNPKINKLYETEYKNIHFDKAFEYLGLILSYFNAIDCIVETKEEIGWHWDAYRKIFLACKNDMSTYNMNEDQKFRLEKIISHISACLLDKSCFNQCVTNLLKHSGEFTPTLTGHNQVIENSTFIKELVGYLKRKFEYLDDNLNTLTENKERHQLFVQLSLLAFYFRIMESNSDTNKKNKVYYEKDLIKMGWNIIQKVSYVNIVGKVTIDLGSYLKKLNPYISSSYDIRDIIKKNDKILSNLTLSIPDIINNLKLYTIAWVNKVESDQTEIQEELGKENILPDTYKKSKNLKNYFEKNEAIFQNILKGLIIANYLRLNISDILFYHVNSDKNTSKNLIISIIQGLEIIKVIENEFKKIIPKILSQIDIFNKCLLFKLQEKLIETKIVLQKKIDGSKKSKEEYSNLYEAACIMYENTMTTPGKLGRMILETCANMMTYFDYKLFEDVYSILANIETLNEIQKYVTSACDCSFMCFYTEMIPIQIEYLFEKKSSRIVYYINAIQDVEEPLKYLIYKEDLGESIIKENRKIIYSILEKKYLLPLSNLIEMDLFQQIHATLIENLNPTKPSETNIGNLLKIGKFKLFDQTIDIKRYIEKRFSSAFYLKTTINPNDFPTYKKIKLYGKLKYDLNFHEIYVPCQSIEQGFDIITIIQKLPSFVDQFSVNLLLQNFIQKVGRNLEASKIRIVGKQQILSSLYTNGTGIINSIVNSVFQYIKVQLKSIISLLADDQIISLLKEENTFWKANKDKISYKYPYERAFEVKSKLKNIFNDNNKHNFILNVTRIGNAVALVHLIRTSLRDYNSANSKHINCENLLQYEELSNNLEIETNNILDANLNQSIYNSFKDSTQMFLETMSSFQQTGLNNINYLGLLVDSFKNTFNDEKFKDLEVFVFLFTAACIKHIENVIVAKKAVAMITNKFNSKAIQGEAYFYNDGFIIGMSYLLKIFKIDKKFKSLNWFKSVIENMENKINSSSKSNRDNEEVNINLEGYQSSAYLTEFNTCLYTYTSVAVLFTD